jgi:hypothetical protein
MNSFIEEFKFLLHFNNLQHYNQWQFNFQFINTNKIKWFLDRNNVKKCKNMWKSKIIFIFIAVAYISKQILESNFSICHHHVLHLYWPNVLKSCYFYPFQRGLALLRNKILKFCLFPFLIEELTDGLKIGCIDITIVFN